mmetsp:Transcript_1618/g.4959  ORF Transcript_1618/g.4959 Transcript_1618/m.4959 type:complete len:383 (-) Transcript_1618:642-1790(-)
MKGHVLLRMDCTARPRDAAGWHRPQVAEAPNDRALASTVVARDQQGLSSVHSKREALKERLPRWCLHGHPIERYDGPPIRKCVPALRRLARRCPLKTREAGEELRDPVPAGLRVAQADEGPHQHPPGPDAVHDGPVVLDGLAHVRGGLRHRQLRLEDALRGAAARLAEAPRQDHAAGEHADLRHEADAELAEEEALEPLLRRVGEEGVPVPVGLRPRAAVQDVELVPLALQHADPLAVQLNPRQDLLIPRLGSLKELVHPLQRGLPKRGKRDRHKDHGEGWRHQGPFPVAASSGSSRSRCRLLHEGRGLPHRSAQDVTQQHGVGKENSDARVGCTDFLHILADTDIRVVDFDAQLTVHDPVIRQVGKVHAMQLLSNDLTPPE